MTASCSCWRSARVSSSLFGESESVFAAVTNAAFCVAPVCMADFDVMRKGVCRHRKRGLAILPTKFGISFTFKPMNQAGALVSIFLDGSIAVAHGGVEMGQGMWPQAQ